MEYLVLSSCCDAPTLMVAEEIFGCLQVTNVSMQKVFPKAWSLDDIDLLSCLHHLTMGVVNPTAEQADTGLSKGSGKYKASCFNFPSGRP